MDCNRWRELASDYVDGTLPAATRVAMDTHAAACVRCRRDEMALTALSRELNVLPTVDPPLFFRENVMAAIERQASDSASQAPWWQRLLGGSAGPERVTRVALGVLLAGGVAAAIAWTVTAPFGGARVRVASLSGGPAPVAPLSGLLPGESETANSDQPLLRVTRVTTVSPNNGPAYDLSFWLSNASKGVARWQFLNDPRSYTFSLNGSSPQTVRVPFSAAQGANAVGLQVHWTADSASHTRFLVLPVHDSGAAPASTDTARQSFGLPDESLADAVRDVSARYGVPITVDDAPANLHLQLTAQDETATQLLQRALKDTGMTVAESGAGIEILAKPGAAAPPQPTDAQ